MGNTCGQILDQCTLLIDSQPQYSKASTNIQKLMKQAPKENFIDQEKFQNIKNPNKSQKIIILNQQKTRSSMRNKKHPTVSKVEKLPQKLKNRKIQTIQQSKNAIQQFQNTDRKFHDQTSISQVKKQKIPKPKQSHFLTCKQSNTPIISQVKIMYSDYSDQQQYVTSEQFLQHKLRIARFVDEYHSDEHIKILKENQKYYFNKPYYLNEIAILNPQSEIIEDNQANDKQQNIKCRLFGQNKEDQQRLQIRSRIIKKNIEKQNVQETTKIQKQTKESFPVLKEKQLISKIKDQNQTDLEQSKQSGQKNNNKKVCSQILIDLRDVTILTSTIGQQS